jgi:hypothetical protein
MLETILTNKLHNQRLFWNFDTFRDYFGYSLHIQEPKWLLPLINKTQYVKNNKSPTLWKTCENKCNTFTMNYKLLKLTLLLPVATASVECIFLSYESCEESTM